MGTTERLTARSYAKIWEHTALEERSLLNSSPQNSRDAKEEAGAVWKSEDTEDTRKLS